MDEQEEKPKRRRAAPLPPMPEAHVEAPGIHVRTLKDIQMPREYLLDYFDIRDPKLVKGAIIHMKREWADLLIVAGKVERV